MRRTIPSPPSKIISVFTHCTCEKVDCKNFLVNPFIVSNTLVTFKKKYPLNVFLVDCLWRLFFLIFLYISFILQTMSTQTTRDPGLNEVNEAVWTSGYSDLLCFPPDLACSLWKTWSLVTADCYSCDSYQDGKRGIGSPHGHSMSDVYIERQAKRVIYIPPAPRLIRS